MNELCENCKKNEGKIQYCEGDYRLHHHGMVHILDGGLKWLCDNCAEIEKEAWERRRKQLAQARQVITL